MRLSSLAFLAAKRAVQKEIEPRLFPLVLYKQILRLHYGLPPPMRVMGDGYVKDEFRRHKTASKEHSMVFLQEWTDYCVTLSKQLSSSGIKRGMLGKDIDQAAYDKFAEEQLHQLLDLKLTAEGKTIEEDSNAKEAREDNFASKQ